jgi:MFS family permease
MHRGRVLVHFPGGQNNPPVTMERTSGARSFFVVIAAIGALAIFSSTLSKTPVLPLFAADLGATPAEIGWIVIASTIPGILISFPAGAISDFFGKRRVLIAALVIFATAPFLYLPVTESWQLTAVRFYHGFATAIFNTVATAALAAQYPQRRAAVLSTYSSVTIVGRSIAPFLGGFLISVASFHSVYWACAISGVLAFAAGLMLPAEPTRPRADVRFPHFFKALRDVLSSRAIMLTSIVEAAQFLVFGAVEAFLALYAAAAGIPPWQIGVILGAQLLSVIVVKPLMGNLSDRLGRRAIIFPGLALGAASVALIPLTANVLALTVLSVLYGVAFATVTSSTTALVADVTRNGQFGASVGVLRTIMDMGQTIGPVLTGFLIAGWGYAVAFPVLGGVIAASAAIFVFVRGSNPNDAHTA